MQRKKFGRRKPRIEAKIFRKEADLPPYFNVSRRRPQDKRFAATRLDKSEEHLDRRAFPRAVRAQEAEDLPATHRQ